MTIQEMMPGATKAANDYLASVDLPADVKAKATEVIALAMAEAAHGFYELVIEVRRLEAGLPKTADGVTIVPGMKLYPLHPLPPDELDGEEDCAIAKMIAVDPLSLEEIEPDDLGNNYSSKEAAAIHRATSPTAADAAQD